MQEKIARRDNDWFRCGQCGHKLAQCRRENNFAWMNPIYPIIEIKCHSCRTINLLEIKGNKNDK